MNKTNGRDNGLKKNNIQCTMHVYIIIIKNRFSLPIGLLSTECRVKKGLLAISKKKKKEEGICV